MQHHSAPSSRRRPALLAGLALAAAFFLVQATTTGAAGAAAAGHEEWSPEEQQFVYELNRARWTPSLWEASAGLTPGTLAPTPPLALNDSLAAAGGFRSDEMADFDYFAHQSAVTGIWPNAVARQFGYPLPDFWPSQSNNIESIHRGNPQISGVLQSFIGSSSHRNHVLGQGWFAAHREIGVGARLDDRVWTILTGTDGSNRVFLTGVVYSDADADGRMDLGEGLEGVTITADGRSTRTNAGGGWALEVSAGRQEVSASGGAFQGEASVVVWVKRYNIAIDFVSVPQRSSLVERAHVFAYETCLGRTPTILGTGGDDDLHGTPGDDVIVGGAGNDRISGGGGNDIICGGRGNDALSGGPGNDTLNGGLGNRDKCTLGEAKQRCES